MPVSVLADLLPSMCSEPWAQDRAALVLTVRHGAPYGGDIAQWASWLATAKSASLDASRRATGVVAAARLLAWYVPKVGADPTAIAALQRRAGMAG
jgi:hypothetical protein